MCMTVLRDGGVCISAHIREKGLRASCLMLATACEDTLAHTFSPQYGLLPHALIALSLLAAKSPTDRLSVANTGTERVACPESGEE
jgi:hypothetical protein